MKKIVWVFLLLYSCLFSIYRMPAIKCMDGEEKLKLEPLDAQIIMDKLVRESEPEK